MKPGGGLLRVNLVSSVTIPLQETWLVPIGIDVNDLYADRGGDTCRTSTPWGMVPRSGQPNGTWGARRFCRSFRIAAPGWLGFLGDVMTFLANCLKLIMVVLLSILGVGFRNGIEALRHSYGAEST